MDRILRSLLFVPANSWRMINTATTEGGDAVILDLEDACPMAEKETGRVFARDSISMLKEKGMDVFVRVNSFDTGLTEEDIRYVVVPGLDGIMLPKSESRGDILMLDQLLGMEEEKKGVAAKSVAILALLESAPFQDLINSDGVVRGIHRPQAQDWAKMTVHAALAKAVVFRPRWGRNKRIPRDRMPLPRWERFDSRCGTKGSC